VQSRRLAELNLDIQTSANDVVDAQAEKLVRDFYLDSYCWRRGATHEGRPAADALVGKAPSTSDNSAR
jgi:hypothetical protein